MWSALTEPDELRAWAPYTADRSLAATGPVTLITIDGPEPVELPGTVTVADAPDLLVYTWAGTTIRWALTDHGSGTRLRLTQDLPDRAQAAMTAAGWHICLDVAAQLIAGSPIGPIVGARALDHGWTELNKQYSERLGMEVVDPPN